MHLKNFPETPKQGDIDLETNVMALYSYQDSSLTYLIFFSG